MFLPLHMDFPTIIHIRSASITITRINPNEVYFLHSKLLSSPIFPELNLLLEPQTFTDLAEMVAKVRSPNRITTGDFSDTESEEDDSEEADGLSEAYDDHDVNDQILRQRRKSSSMQLSDGDFIPSS